MDEHSQPQQAWGGFGKSTSPSWCHLELPGLSIPWWHSDFGHAKGNPISLWLVFSLAVWIQDVFCNIFTAEGN